MIRHDRDGSYFTFRLTPRWWLIVGRWKKEERCECRRSAKCAYCLMREGKL